MGELLLDVRDLRTHIRTRRGIVKAVDGVSFTLERGESLGLVGESGSGKSISCMSLLGLLPPNAWRAGGQVFFRGEELTAKPERAMRRIRGSSIGMVLQDPMASLNPAMRIGQQVGEPLVVHRGVSRRESVRQATELLRVVSISDAEHRVRNYPHQMSGGMRQRAVGAAAISCEPELLIADEPTTSLDVTIQAQYLRLLKDLQRRLDAGLIFVTHDLSIVTKVCTKVAVMYAGRIVEIGPTAEVFDRPQHPYTRGLLDCMPSLSTNDDRLATIKGQPPDMANLKPGCSFADRCRFAKQQCRTQDPFLVEIGPAHASACLRVGTIDLTGSSLIGPGRERREDPMPGEDRPRGTARPAIQADEPAAADVVFEVRDVTKHYARPWKIFGSGEGKGTLRAVDGVSFTVRRGETFGIVGESGSGKSTTAKLLLMMEQATGGQVLFRGVDVETLRGDALREYRRSVQAVFQDLYSSLNPRMKLDRTIVEPLLATSGRLEKSVLQDRLGEVLEAVGLPLRVASQYPHELSGGQRQRVAVARSIITRPDCVILDEPVSALDVSFRAQVINLLCDLRDRLGVSFVLIAHDLPLVKYISTNVGVMYLGVLVEQGAADRIYARPLHPYTQVLLDNALPSRPGEHREEMVLSGEIPSPHDPPSGCRFHTRCPHVMPVCREVVPKLREQAPDHAVSCHLYPQD